MTHAGARAAVRVAVGVAAAILVTLTGTMAPAQAHASLTGSSPAAGASLTRAPTKVTLRYDENIRDPSVVIVTGPDGRRVDHDGTQVLDNTASVDVRGGARGSYRVSYRVISADGHPVSGTVRFSLDGEGASASSAPVDAAPTRSDATSHLAWIVGGAAVLVVLALLLMTTRGSRRPGAHDEERSTP